MLLITSELVIIVLVVRLCHLSKLTKLSISSCGFDWNDNNCFFTIYTQLSRRRDRESGLHTLKFNVISIVNMTINGAPFKMANLDLFCDYNKTPFCDHPS